VKAQNGLWQIERQNMKKMNRVLLAATVAAVLGIGNAALAQSQVVGDDGIAASPKVRAQLNERRASEAVVAPAKAAVVVSERTTKPAPVSIAASPKVAQAIAEREASQKASIASANVASTTSRADDGIAASPKVRQQMNERGQVVEIAPVK